LVIQRFGYRRIQLINQMEWLDGTIARSSMNRRIANHQSSMGADHPAADAILR
jgi:hypothetical protein